MDVFSRWTNLPISTMVYQILILKDGAGGQSDVYGDIMNMEEVNTLYLRLRGDFA